MDFHKSSSKGDGKGAREIVETGLCCSQEGDVVGKKNKVRLTETSREHLMKGHLASLEGPWRCSVTISRDRNEFQRGGEEMNNWKRGDGGWNLHCDSVVSAPSDSQKDRGCLSAAELPGIGAGKPAAEMEPRRGLSARGCHKL